MSQETPRPNFMFAQDLGPEPLLREPARVRIVLLAFSGVLALLGLWMLISAILAPTPAGDLPLDRQSAAAAAARRQSAQWAAWLGLVRGDLYARAAFADATALFVDRPQGQQGAAQQARARANALAAVSLAPINGAAWFFLAALPPAKDGEKAADPSRATAALLTSYFTAPNDPALARARLQTALASPVAPDRDLLEFMKGDLRAIVAASPQTQAAVVAAYRAAAPQNRAAFDTLASETDAAFARTLRGDATK